MMLSSDTNELTNFIADLLPIKTDIQSVEKLFGEASYREYFRIHCKNTTSYILMKLPAGKQSVSEEITNYRGENQELPFLNIARYLNRHELPAPKVFGQNLDQGLILLQDLGDRNLERLVGKSNQPMTHFFYQQAIDLLLRLQQIGTKHPDDDCMAFKRSFDENLLNWEINHFFEYGIEDRFQIKIPDSERKKMESIGQEIVAEIVKIPYGLTHRDFQSRNLMFFGYEFYLIDFQDALLGPPQYDLVALLRDSYIQLEERTVERLIDYYLQRREDLQLPEMDRIEFRKNFDRITLQRKLKDTGRFQYIHTVKGNSKFLIHVPTSLSYIKTAFARLPEYQELADSISKYIPELQ